jgi:hypothetical protein
VNTGGEATGGEATGGVSTGGVATGGEATGGVNTGGVATTGGVSTGGEATGGTSTGGAGCVTGETSGNEVVIIGDSFLATSTAPTIPERIQERAVEAGSLGSTDNYITEAEGGASLANGQIPNQYGSAQASNNIRFVIMDGGLLECQQNTLEEAVTAATALFQTMAEDGVEAVLYFFYPDPMGTFAFLESRYDTLRLQMQSLCEGLAAPKCYWLDLRTDWYEHENEFYADGVHPNSTGCIATGNAIWEKMEEHCIAQ